MQSSRHQVVLEELIETWEDLRDRDTGSRVVLVAVPHRWGRSRVLEEFRGVVEDLGGSPMFSVSCCSTLTRRPVRFSSGWASAACSPPGWRLHCPLLLTSLAVTAAGNAWDACPAGQQGPVARAARAVAAESVAAPVLVTVDDAELLDLGLAVTMIENLAGRHDGQVLVVATIMPGSDLEAELLSSARYELLGRVRKAEADPDMSYGAP